MTRRSNTAYGPDHPLQKVPPLPVVTSRTPGHRDVNHAIGRVWVAQDKANPGNSVAHIFLGVSSLGGEWDVIGTNRGHVDHLFAPVSGTSTLIPGTSGGITFVEGTGITIEGDASSSSITFSLASPFVATSLQTSTLTSPASTDLLIQAGDAGNLDLRLGGGTAGKSIMKVTTTEATPVEVLSLTGAGTLQTKKFKTEHATLSTELSANMWNGVQATAAQVDMQIVPKGSGGVVMGSSALATKVAGNVLEPIGTASDLDLIFKPKGKGAITSTASDDLMIKAQPNQNVSFLFGAASGNTSVLEFYQLNSDGSAGTQLGEFHGITGNFILCGPTAFMGASSFGSPALHGQPLVDTVVEATLGKNIRLEVTGADASTKIAFVGSRGHGGTEVASVDGAGLGIFKGLQTDTFSLSSTSEMAGRVQLNSGGSYTITLTQISPTLTDTFCFMSYHSTNTNNDSWKKLIYAIDSGNNQVVIKGQPGQYVAYFIVKVG